MKKTNTKLLFSMVTLALTLTVLWTSAQERRQIGNMILEDVPEVPQDIRDRIQQYQNTRSASLADWLPGDGGMMIATRFANTMQLHTVQMPGGARSQITFFDEPVPAGSFCPSPDYNGFMFPRDIGGNEFTQIFWYDMDKRTSEMISDGESVNFMPTWSNAGDRFAYTSTRRNKRDFDIYVSDMASPKEARLLVDRGMGYWIVSEWAPDDSKLLLVQYLGANAANSYIYDMGSGTLQPLNDPRQPGFYGAIAWNARGDQVYLVSDRDREFKTLAVYDLASGQMRYITADIPWDVGDFTMNRQRTRAAFTVNENGFSKLYMMDLRDHSYRPVENLPMGQIYGIRFHPVRNELGMVINSTQTPGDVYSLDLGNGGLSRWTYSEVGGLDTSYFPEPELIFYDTFDEVDGAPRKIPAFVYKPKRGSGPFPVVVNIHGGPEAQHQPFFSSMNAFLANELGVAVIGPNVRGSSGYGKTYLDLDNGFLREDAVKDIGKLIDWINEQPEFDGSRIAVYGGSYGGYMVLASMFHFNDRLRCGVNVVGISNFVTFLENTEEYRRDLRRAEYGDERDPDMREFLLSISPTNHVDKIRKPLFVIQGANDPRVPASESDQMVQAIREHNGHVWYMLALDEGHGFRKKENQDRMTEAVAYFLKLNLLGE